MRTVLRFSLAILGGNLMGLAAFHFALWAAPQWWAAAGAPMTFGTRLALIAATAIAFAAPPVMVGAAAARVAAGHEPLVGMAAAAWGLSAWQWWPAGALPLLPPESWIAPTALILLSGLMGGWLVGQGARG